MQTRLRLLASLAVAFFVPGLGAAPPERLLGAPAYDNFSEATYKKVTWNDFKGEGRKPPGTNRWNLTSFAHIACGLKLGAIEAEDRERDGLPVTVPVKVRPYAVMDKLQSAVKSGSRNDYVLAHEQIHFDLAEVVARRLAVELADFEGHGETVQEARLDLDKKIGQRFEQARDELRELQSSYDGETKNGQVKKKQKKWAERAAVMFDEATAALREELEKQETPAER